MKCSECRQIRATRFGTICSTSWTACRARRTPFDRCPPIAAGTDGRLWFSTSNGIVWIDPKHAKHNTLEPNVEVQSIVADGRRYRAGSGSAAADQDAQSADRLHRTEPVDSRARQVPLPARCGEPWQDAGPRRTAYFTDLAPGDYTFPRDRRQRRRRLERDGRIDSASRFRPRSIRRAGSTRCARSRASAS